MNILVFGDSIALGLWDENGGWVGRLTKLLVEKALKSELEEDYEVYNLGLSGDTTEGLLQRLEFETKQRLGSDETVIVFAIGINDSEYCHSTKQLRMPPDKIPPEFRRVDQPGEKICPQNCFHRANAGR